jgi:BirA family biotin operon repressor/biotin-[acetyl-CoA-carboxylase] ligase
MAPVLHEAVRPPRPPVRATTLARALVRPGALWSEVRVVAETGSTNDDVAGAARAGAAEGLVLVAESQLGGRGRLGRSWQAPAGAGLTMSVLLRPRSVAATGLGWLPLLAGVAVVQACGSEVAAIEAGLKWPNDLLARPAEGRWAQRFGDQPSEDGWRKYGGILAEVVAPDAIAIGIGVNVSQQQSELPEPIDPLAYRPASLAMVGGHVDRERLAVAVLRRLSHWYARWIGAGGDPDACGLAAAYRAHCRTLGQAVTVTRPGGEALRGTATDVDADGRLLVRTPESEYRLAAGDVHHLRGVP